MPSPPIAAAHTAESGRTQWPAFALVTSLFFMWGFLTVMNDILIPHFKIIFDLNYAQAMFVQFTFFIAYFLLSLPSGGIVKAVGYKYSMVIGLATMAAGAWLFLAAASGPYYGFFLLALFVLASGMTLLQVSSNPYVTALGPARTASSRLNLAQAVNSLGTAIAPALGGILILGAGSLTIDELHRLPETAQQAYRVSAAATVKLPYLVFGAMLVLLAVLVWRFRLPVLPAIEGDSPSAEGGRSVWRVRHLMLGAAGIFLYCGAEVAIGSFLVNFLADPKIAGLPPAVAAHYVSLYWTGAMIGRFVGAALLQRIRASNLLGWYGAIASLLVWICVFSTGHAAMWTIISVGLFNSIMFPNIFALAIEDLGPLTGYGSGVLIMAILGAAVVPLAQGLLADRIGVHHAYFLPALCYLYVVYYGFRGCRHQGAQQILGN
jgi:FHS family L-fucose permease-like MFS transporter